MCHGLCRSHDLRELPAVIENFHDAQMQNPLPEENPKKKGRSKRGKVEVLIDHLILRKDQWLFFFMDFSVPFTNLNSRKI